MKTKWNRASAPFLALMGLLLITADAYAAPGSQRVAHFDASGTNTIRTTRIFTATSSSCMITITNASTGTSSQTFTLNITATYNGTAATLPDGTTRAGTLAPGDTVVHFLNYAAIPANTIGNQNLVCKGSITVQDADSTVSGFLIASGTLGTFTENGAAQITSGTGSALFEGSLSTSQIPISIGEGRPF